LNISAPFALFYPPIAPFVFFAPLTLKIAPEGAIPPTLRNTALESREIERSFEDYKSQINNRVKELASLYRGKRDSW